tara:strand:+ start:849 stop:1052 length:204 start_codon:yes stop_codon:yes gene_type:complete
MGFGMAKIDIKKIVKTIRGALKFMLLSVLLLITNVRYINANTIPIIGPLVSVNMYKIRKIAADSIKR